MYGISGHNESYEHRVLQGSEITATPTTCQEYCKGRCCRLAATDHAAENIVIRFRVVSFITCGPPWMPHAASLFIWCLCIYQFWFLYSWSGNQLIQLWSCLLPLEPT